MEEKNIVVRENVCWKQGRNDLRGRWGEAVLLTFVYFLLSWMFSSIVGAGLGLINEYLTIVASFILFPLQWGYFVTFVDCHRGDTDPFNVKNLFVGYKDFVRIFGTVLLQMVYIVLWSLLLVVPGIIKSMSYALTPYILKDNPELKYNSAIEQSMAMMEGYKAELFVLCLKYLGWTLLAILTLGIGMLWVIPYYSAAMANFYEDVKAAYNERSGNTF